MPIYAYRCPAGHEHERLERGTDRAERGYDVDTGEYFEGTVRAYPSQRPCPDCGEPARRTMAAPSVPRSGTYSYDEGGTG